MEFLNNDSDTSSFNDGDIPISEEEYFSSEFIASETSFVKPTTRTKDQVFQALINTDKSKEDSVSEKSAKRLGILTAFRDFQKQKQTFKSIKRFQNVKNLNLQDINEEATMLRDLEIIDKKLNRDFYYSPDEPNTYKKLLNKRRNAIHKKYQRYAQDPDYRKWLELQQVENLKNFGNQLNPDEFISIGSNKNEEEFIFEEDYAEDSYDEVSNEMPIQTYGPWPKLNLNEILNESAIDFDTSPAALFQKSWEEEIINLTSPEIIDAAVNNEIDFNELAHETSIGPDTPNLSLIEAFDCRVSHEQKVLKENFGDGRSFSDKITEKNWTKNEFLNAIKCLSLAEEESAFDNNSNNLSIEESDETFKPLQILAYIGTTKPSVK